MLVNFRNFFTINLLIGMIAIRMTPSISLVFFEKTFLKKICGVCRFDLEPSVVLIKTSNNQEEISMRFMMIVKATEDSEAGNPPSQELLDAMLKYNEELAKAGVLVAAEGLYPSSGAIRISYPVPDGKPKVIDGPFTEAKELIAGFTLIEVQSSEEAIKWAMRMPDPNGLGQGEIELRQVFEAPELTEDPVLLAKEIHMRETVTRRKNR